MYVLNKLVGEQREQSSTACVNFYISNTKQMFIPRKNPFPSSWFTIIPLIQTFAPRVLFPAINPAFLMSFPICAKHKSTYTHTENVQRCEFSFSLCIIAGRPLAIFARNSRNYWLSTLPSEVTDDSERVRWFSRHFHARLRGLRSHTLPERVSTSEKRRCTGGGRETVVRLKVLRLFHFWHGKVLFNFFFASCCAFWRCRK